MHTSQNPMQAANTAPSFADASVQLVEPDFALGCECADPRLTIEMWDAVGESAAADSHHH